jgi:hypothetical protein
VCEVREAHACLARARAGRVRSKADVNVARHVPASSALLVGAAGVCGVCECAIVRVRSMQEVQCTQSLLIATTISRALPASAE